MDLRVDHRPLASQIRDVILAMMRSEGLNPGDRLPSEQTLVERFGISRTVLREALKLLEEERVVTCQHGVGRFIAQENPGGLSEDITRLASKTELSSALNVEFQCCVLGVEVREAGTEIGKYLNQPPETQIIVLERAWLESSKAVMVSVDHFPRSFLHGPISSELFETSLISLLERNGMPRLEYAKSTIRAVTLPSRYALQLRVKRCEPWVLLEQINFSARDIPLLYSQDYYFSKRFWFRVLRRRR